MHLIFGEALQRYLKVFMLFKILETRAIVIPEEYQDFGGL